MDRLRRRLVVTLELIREVEAERDEAAEAKPQDQACRKIAALCRIRGLGDNFAAVLTREVFYRPSALRRCPTRAAVWTAIGALVGREIHGQGRL